ALPVASERQGAGRVSRAPRAHGRKPAMDRRSGRRLRGAGTAGDGDGAGAAPPRPGFWPSAIERPVRRTAAGPGHHHLPGAAASGLRAVLRPLRGVRSVVVVLVPAGVLAPVVPATGGVRLG